MQTEEAARAKTPWPWVTSESEYKMVGAEGVKAGAVGEKNQHGRFTLVTRQAFAPSEMGRHWGF